MKKAASICRVSAAAALELGDGAQGRFWTDFEPLWIEPVPVFLYRQSLTGDSSNRGNYRFSILS